MNSADIRVGSREPWYKYGVAILLFEMVVAIAISGYSLYMTFNGLGGFPGKQLRPTACESSAGATPGRSACPSVAFSANRSASFSVMTPPSR
jgi:hypothetical protein